ncbi:mitochondria protoheme IX farnesyltransferase [Xylona heveae TC161]|uniref:Protoheme IX farnesyltransferase, mitochondrial n=1 Tax=Xylona heveae (strain CBS 132557 / TC161) TaxID=1328760 RepID=A0A165JG95_XYLHT|nr:mitochondria protoheme IX farnesyltransferase [Xylona heveae TC161]KZF26198.1 mitochondria protoheme IX farnesyltransferase [Xylona heveae TC161]
MILRPARHHQLVLNSLNSGSVCSKCLFNLNTTRPSSRLSTRSFSALQPRYSSFFTSRAISFRSAEATAPTRPLRRGYFLSNGFPDKIGTATVGVAAQGQFRSKTTEGGASSPIINNQQAQASAEAAADVNSKAHNTSEELPHRRRKRQRQSEAEKNASTEDSDTAMPLDASARLSTLSSTLPVHSFRRRFTTYLALSKPRLSFMIVLTTATAYSLYPVPALLSPATTSSPSLSTLTLLFLTAGTALSCASANAFNMLMEPEHDAKMSRTRNRPLVRNLIRPRGALIFAVLSGVVGVGSLYYGVNPTVAFLSGLNIFIYAGLYTPMKRISVINTWVGAIVGGIPPLMGWVAAAGESASGNGDWKELLFGQGSAGGWLLAALLFTWQFPHFNALSWTIREEYKFAGYRMLAFVNPRMNGRVALRYSLLFFPICYGLWYVGVTDKGFLFTSSLINAWLVREAWRFWRLEGYKGSARALFWASVWHLPVLMVLAMAHKKGLWERVWKSVTGTPDEELDDDWDTDSTEAEEIVASVE